MKRQRSAGTPTALHIDVVASGVTRAPGLARWLQSVAPSRARGDVTVRTAWVAASATIVAALAESVTRPRRRCVAR